MSAVWGGPDHVAVPLVLEVAWHEGVAAGDVALAHGAEQRPATITPMQPSLSGDRLLLQLFPGTTQSQAVGVHSHVLLAEVRHGQHRHVLPHVRRLDRSELCWDTELKAPLQKHLRR